MGGVVSVKVGRVIISKNNMLAQPLGCQLRQVIQGGPQCFSHTLQIRERTHARQHMGRFGALLAAGSSATGGLDTPPGAVPVIGSRPPAPPDAYEIPTAQRSENQDPSALTPQYFL